MLLLQERMRLLERLQLGDLARVTRRRCFRRSPAQPTVARVLPPLRKHERVDLQRQRDSLHLQSLQLT